MRAFLCTQPACISRDGVHFITFAKQLAEDPIKWMQVTTKQPGMAWLLLGTHRLVGPIVGDDAPIAWQRCGQLIALLGGVCACGLLYLLTRRLFDTTTAAVAGILAAFWWQGAQLSADVLSDMPHLAAYLLALLVGYAALRSKQTWALAACGLIAGLAYMFRQEAIGIVAAVGVCWLWPNQGLRPRKRLLGIAVLAVCFAVVVAPYAVAVGKIMPNKSLHDLFRGSADVSGAFGFGQDPSLLLAHVIPWWQAPIRMVEAWSRSGRYAISTLVLLGVLLRSAPRAETTGRRLIVAAVLMQTLLVQARVTTYGEISSRYMVIPLALSIPWAASGLVTLLNTVIERLHAAGNAAKAAVLIIGIILPLAPQLYCLLPPVNSGTLPLRAAGQWLRDNTDPDQPVLAHERLEQVMFYAGRTYPDQTWLRIPETASIAEIRRHVARPTPAWFVDVEASRRKKSDETAHFRALQDGSIPQLLLKQTIGPAGSRVHIFSISGTPLPKDEG